jgi:hypothetical protein
VDWDAIGAVGEILGAVAVFVTLIYLASQIRYARLTAMDTNRAHRVEAIREINGVVANNSDVRAAWNKAIGPAYRKVHTDIAQSMDLSFDEASLVITQGANWHFTIWAHWRSLKSPSDEQELIALVRALYREDPMKALIRHPGFRAYFDEAFVRWIEETLDEVPRR